MKPRQERKKTTRLEIAEKWLTQGLSRTQQVEYLLQQEQGRNFQVPTISTYNLTTMKSLSHIFSCFIFYYENL